MSGVEIKNKDRKGSKNEIDDDWHGQSDDEAEHENVKKGDIKEEKSDLNKPKGLGSLFDKKQGGQDKTKKKYDGQKKPYDNKKQYTKKPESGEGGPMTFKSNNKNDDGLFMTEKERNAPRDTTKVEKKDDLQRREFKGNNKTDNGLFMTEEEKNAPKETTKVEKEIQRPDFKGKINAKEYKPTTVQDVNIEKKEEAPVEIEKPTFKVKDGNLVDINTGADLYSKISFKEDKTVYHDGKKHDKDGEGDKKQERTFNKNNDRKYEDREKEYKPKPKQEVVVVEETDSDGFIKIDSTKKKNPSKSTKYEGNEFRGDKKGRGGYKKPYNKDGRKQYNENKGEGKGQYKSGNEIGAKGEITSSEMADGLSREQFEDNENKNETRKISTETKPVTKTTKIIVEKKNLKNMFG